MKMRTILAILVVALSSISSALAKDSGSINGKIMDNQSQPVAYANVLLFSASDSALVKAEYSGPDGSFEMQNVPPGEFWLNVSFVGMSEYVSQPFAIMAGEVKSLGELRLSPASVELSAVTVVAKKALIEVHPDKTVFNVENSINATGSDAMELLRKAPGVVVDNNDNVIMNGKNGVQIYIDGKRSPLTASELAAYLRTIPSSDLAAIEIIANPSAKWDAEGNAGIINIRMKKDKRYGANGRTSLGYSVGKRQGYTGSLSGNYRNKALNAFGSYSYNDGKELENFNLNREQYGSYFQQRNQNLGEHSSHNYKFGTDFFLGEKHTVGFLLNGNNSDYQYNTKSRTPIGSIGSEVPDKTLIASSRHEGQRSNYNFNLNYRFDNAAGVTWNVDADYGIFENEGSNDQPNEYRNGDGGEGSTLDSAFNYANRTRTGIDIGTFKLDHERPFLKGQLGLGLKYAYVKTDNDFNFFRVIEGEQVLDEDRTNFFTYTENVNAAYASYARQLGKFSVQAGLRVEQTRSEGDLRALKPVNDQNVKRDYLNFFPSGGITYVPSEKHMWQLNYSRRIDRPNYQDLNPFESRLDELTYEKGNPFLNPQFTNNLSLGHTFMQMVNASLTWSHTSDLFERIVDIDSRDSSASFITWQNIATQNNLTLNLGSPVPINKWWEAYVNLSAFRTSNEADFGDGKTVDLKAYVFNVYAQQTFKLPLDMSLELSGWYNSPMLWGGTFKMEDMWSLDAGLKKKLLKGKGSLTLAVSDIFYTIQWKGTSRLGDLYMRANGNSDSRRFRVNFTYNFGNDQVKAARNRSTGLEDEKGRIKDGN